MVKRPHLRAILFPCSLGLCGDVLSCLICPWDSEVELVQGGESVERGLKSRGGTTLSLSPHHLPSPACRVNNPGAACSRWSLTEYQQHTLWREKPLLHGKLSREPRQPHNSPHPDWRPALKDSLGKREWILEGIEKSKGVVGYRGQQRIEVKERCIESNSKMEGRCSETQN